MNYTYNELKAEKLKRQKERYEKLEEITNGTREPPIPELYEYKHKPIRTSARKLIEPKLISGL